MSNLRWRRVLTSGVVAGLVWIILGSLVTAVLGRPFAALPNNRLGHPTTGFVLSNILIDLVEGISMMWLYAAIRPRYGKGNRTATIAALAWWFIVTLGDATWCSFGLFPAYTVIPLIIGTLPAVIVATLIGVRFYRSQSQRGSESARVASVD
jgi:hypothetical protein